jgi:aspartyl-tRNA(Asn)/glutamyl-tRNA(Gln) amidotransferase subunit C
MITTQDIQKLAELSRIKIAPEEQESLRSEIESILGYIDQIKKATQASVDDEKSGDVSALRNIMREDGAPHASGIFTEKILSQAPAREGNYLKVKKIL